MPIQRRTRVKRQVASDANDDIIFELVDDDDDDEEADSSSSSGDDVHQQEENPSAPSQLVWDCSLHTFTQVPNLGLRQFRMNWMELKI